MENEMAPVRGGRDFLPEEKEMRDAVAESIRLAFESYGFEPIETPALEKFEVLSSKFAGGEEILKEVFALEDQGKRKLGLRYDLTVPLCRVVADNPRMPMPFKRYQIAPVWRDGPLKAGRYREFVQCDADTVGSDSPLADAELLSLAKTVLGKWLGKRVEIRVSDRRVLAGLLESAGIPESQAATAMLSLDKLEKIGEKGVAEELERKGVEAKAATKVLQLLSEKGGNPEILASLEKKLKSESGKEGVKSLARILELCKKLGCADVVRVDPSLARGLNYYTGTVFEAYVKNGAISSSVAGGGRYDDLIGRFTGAGKIPAVGISFGLDVIMEILKELKVPAHVRRPRVFVVPVSKEYDEAVEALALDLTRTIRALGVSCSVDLMGRNPAKNLEYAAKKGFRYAFIVGAREAAERKVTVRDLVLGSEQVLPFREALKHLY